MTHGNSRAACSIRRTRSTLRQSNYYTPFPRQSEFHRSKAKYRLFGGAAGPGKTKALLWEAIAQANEVPGCDTLLLRRTYPELDSSLLAYFRRDVPRSLYRHFSEAKRIVTWHNGSTTRFGYCRHEGDVYQYQGAEFLFIGVDELTHFTLKQWQFLTSRNRCAAPGAFPCMAGATNPGNVGHSWVKALWIDKKPAPGMENSQAYDSGDYEFIAAKIDDNPIYKNDMGYRRTLAALPKNLRRAFLNGDWDVFAGQYFDLFEIGRHTVRPETLRIEPWWPRWISIDWGFNHPSAVYWHVAIPAIANSSGTNHSSVGPRVVTYREYVRDQLSPRMLGQAILECTRRERIAEVFLSPDAYAERGAEASVAAQLGEVFTLGGLPQPVRADNDRIGGWQLLYQLLEGDHWLIGENCRKLIECLPTLTRDDKRVEDIHKCDGDDPADSARYGLVSGLRIAFPRGLPITLHRDLFGPATMQSNHREPPTPNASARDQSPWAQSPMSQTAFSSADEGKAVNAVAPNSIESTPLSNAGGEAPQQNPLSFYPDGYSTPYQNVDPRQNTLAPHPSSRLGSYNDPAWDRFAPPLNEYLARQVTATDPSSRAIWLQKLEAEARGKSRSVPLRRRRR
jgi:hypothetical protein